MHQEGALVKQSVPNQNVNKTLACFLTCAVTVWWPINAGLGFSLFVSLNKWRYGCCFALLDACVAPKPAAIIQQRYGTNASLITSWVVSLLFSLKVIIHKSNLGEAFLDLEVWEQSRCTAYWASVKPVCLSYYFHWISIVFGWFSRHCIMFWSF